MSSYSNFKSSWIFAALALLSGLGVNRSLSADELNRLTDGEKQEGWQLLFDGKTTKGWRNYKADSVSDGWEVKDGVLSRVGKSAGDIVTDAQYGAFELSLEYRISKGGNSGLMFHVTEELERPWQTGPEIQIQDNVDGHDPQKAGWLYQLYSASEDATRPAGQWNELRVLISPAGSSIYMNGVRYAQFKKGSRDWDERVAQSKFAKFENFGKPERGHICLQDHGNLVSFRNVKIRDLEKQAEPRDAPALAGVKIVPAFEQVEWADWKPITDDGQAEPQRPIVLTHAGDQSNRVFVAMQRGEVHVLSGSDATKSKVFLNIRPKVAYSDRQNEEGLLGLAFHPEYAKNGQLFIYYTSSRDPQTSIISRFRASKDNPDQADPASEEEILRIEQPFWNHNGGTIAFGPDGYLYVGLGDGGAGNDPHGNGQNLGTLLGSILRIDVDHQQEGLNYAIPKDNPFVNHKGARGEIWAYGLRNVWRLSFDRKTGELWAGDVGQNLWEEINLITKGGNYGWNLREGKHDFGAKSGDAATDLIEPIFEYSHNVGKSITGGGVYRGGQAPALQGAYVYADYVTGKIWALQRGVGSEEPKNWSIPSPNKFPVITFGEDEQGELYFAVVSNKGRGLYRFVSE